MKQVSCLAALADHQQEEEGAPPRKRASRLPDSMADQQHWEERPKELTG